MKPLASVVVVLIALMWVFTNAAFASREKARDMKLQLMQTYATQLSNAEAVLKSKASDTWTQQEIEDYLCNALYTLYFGTGAYIWENWRQPYDAADLQSMVSFPAWPGNPFNNWEPIEFKRTTDPFSPGDVIFQSCPPSEYTGVENPVALTFVISINGPSATYVPIDAEKTICIFEDWAITPPGTACAEGARWEPAWKTREKREKKEKH